MAATDNPFSVPARQCATVSGKSPEHSFAVGDLIIPVASSNLRPGLFLPVFAATQTTNISFTLCNPFLGDLSSTTDGNSLEIKYYAVSP